MTRTDSSPRPSAAIETIETWRVLAPLVTPYRLSFGPQSHFDCVIVRLTLDDGGEGWGEAALLPGYTDEDIDGSWALAGTIAGEAIGMTGASLSERLVGLMPAKAFTACAFLTAMEQARVHPTLAVTGRQELLGTVNGKPDDRPALEAEIERLLATGYRTLKVKVGWDLESDLSAVDLVRRIVAGRAMLRVDGNQGFDTADGVAFVSRLSPEQIELVEQPCDAHDWDAAVAVSRAAAMPVMLDEQIYDEGDIRRAAELGCADYIKLKLMKMGSLDALHSGLRLIRELGMKPVMGNGVATDLGCWMEACVGALELDNAGEMNGFLKMHSGILGDPIRTDGAHVVLDGRPRLVDRDRLEALSQETRRWQA